MGYLVEVRGRYSSVLACEPLIVVEALGPPAALMNPRRIAVHALPEHVLKADEDLRQVELSVAPHSEPQVLERARQQTLPIAALDECIAAIAGGPVSYRPYLQIRTNRGLDLVNEIPPSGARGPAEIAVRGGVPLDSRQRERHSGLSPVGEQQHPSQCARVCPRLAQRPTPPVTIGSSRAAYKT